MHAQWIDIQADDGLAFKAYLSLPPTGRGPAILLLQEIFGVNRHIRAVADQYALDGYVVLAPDLFWRAEPGLDIGYTQADMQHGMGLKQGYDLARGLRDLAQAAAALRARAESSGGVASLGYCFGGLLSCLCASQGFVDAAVCYYPGGIQNELARASAIRSPVQFHFGALDKHLGPPVVDAVRAAFAGRTNSAVHLYPDADHGFNCWDRAAYQQRAAVRAHGRSLEFLADALA